MPIESLTRVFSHSYWGMEAAEFSARRSRLLKASVVVAVAIAILGLPITSATFYATAISSLAFSLLHTVVIIYSSNHGQPLSLTDLKIRRVYQVLFAGLMVATVAFAGAGILGLVSGVSQIATCWRAAQMGWTLLSGLQNISWAIGLEFFICRHLFNAANRSTHLAAFPTRKSLQPLTRGLFRELNAIFKKVMTAKLEFEEARPFLEAMETQDFKEHFESQCASLSLREIKLWVDLRPKVLTISYLLQVLDPARSQEVILSLMPSLNGDQLDQMRQKIQAWELEMPALATQAPTQELYDLVGDRIEAIGIFTRQLEAVHQAVGGFLDQEHIGHQTVERALQALRTLSKSPVFRECYEKWSTRVSREQPLYIALSRLRLRLPFSEQEEETSALMALCNVGFRQSTCQQLVATWGLPSHENAFKAVENKLASFGLSKEKDLLEARILSPKENLSIEQIQARLLDYVRKRSRFSVLSFFKGGIQAFSSRSRLVALASHLYEYVLSIGLFLFQWRRQAIATSVGFLYGMSLNLRQERAPHIVELTRVFQRVGSVDPIGGLQLEQRSRWLALRVTSTLFTLKKMPFLGSFFMGINHADMISRYARPLFYQA